MAGPARAGIPAELHVTGSPFAPDGDGHRERVIIELESGEDVIADLRIRDFDGRLVLVLADGSAVPAGLARWTWDGRGTDGRRVPDGPYLVRAVLRGATGTRVRQRWITKAPRVPYAIRPGAVLVVVDAGHGGSSPGAVHGGLEEADVNLDVALRLGAMLEGAGVGVIQTRRRDVDVSERGVDLNGDGRYDRKDELVARNDIANVARADVHVAIHHNAVACHCVRGTEMYTHDRRSWSPEGMLLARSILAAHLTYLGDFAFGGWRPRDRGVRIHPFMALRPWHRRVMPRPSLQPSVLGESLYLDHPMEGRLLARPRVRAAIAAAYFDGVARFLARRRHGLRYEVVAAPTEAVAGSTASIDLRLTDRGHSSSAGWRLLARIVPAVRRYDGRPLRGPVVARLPLPDGLDPGETVEVRFDVPLPATPGTWLVKLDVVLPEGGSLGRHGVVGPQLRVRTTP